MADYIEVPTASGSKTIAKQAIIFVEVFDDDKSIVHLNRPSTSIVVTETYASLTARLET